MKIQHSEPVGPLRAAAYPPVGDQLDAVVAGLAALRDQGIELPEKTLALLDQCEAVKRTFAKPEGRDGQSQADR